MKYSVRDGGKRSPVPSFYQPTECVSNLRTSEVESDRGLEMIIEYAVRRKDLCVVYRPSESPPRGAQVSFVILVVVILLSGLLIVVTNT